MILKATELAKRHIKHSTRCMVRRFCSGKALCTCLHDEQIQALANDICRTFGEEVARLREDVEQLRTALRPFAGDKSLCGEDWTFARAVLKDK